MEPKTIKEETIEKEVTSYIDTQGPLRTRSKTALSTTTTTSATTKDRCKTPDSPEGARLSQIAPASPTQSSPVRASTTTTINGTLSPVHHNGDSLTPPPPVSTTCVKETASTNTSNTNNYSPLSLSVSNLDHISQLSASHQHLYGGGANHLPGTNSISGHLAAAAVAPLGRPLAKLKRFLGTLVQFGQDIGPEIGDRVRTLVLSLVSSSVTVEDFHHSLQDVTNFPLRPFVLPFLRAHLPPLQREVHALARAAKQTPLQYLRAHDHVILEPAHSPAEPSEIFLSTSAETPPIPTIPTIPTTTAVKRRASDTLYENGLIVNGGGGGPPSSQQQTTPTTHETLDYTPATKRPYNNFLMSSHQQSLLGLGGGGHPPPHTHFLDYSHHNTYTNRLEDDPNTSGRNSSRGDEEWRNIHVMLNCILSMVEKTKRALSILQQRNSQDLTSEWLRKQDVSADLKKAAGDIMAQAVRQTEDRVAEVKRKAEEAVNDVKRQAVVELQKAVAAAEIKANELVANERAKMEKMLLEARKHSDDTSAASAHADPENSQSPPVNTQPAAPSQQNSCWNCGRKAHETCSGCSIARYCGPFCQHKDWENHHQVCVTRVLVTPGDKCRTQQAQQQQPQRVTTPSTTNNNNNSISTSSNSTTPSNANSTHAQDTTTARLKK